MRKFFNVEGVCRPKEHFMVDVTERVESICKMVDNGDYFCVNSGRLFGKSTLLRAVADRLSDKYLVFRISLKGIDEEILKDEDKFLAKFMELFCKSCIWIPVKGLKNKLLINYKWINSDFKSLPIDHFPFTLEQLLKVLKKPAVLMIDEIDRVIDFPYFEDFIKVFSSMFIERESHLGFQSVIMAGVNNLKDLSVELGGGRYYEPWKIAVPLELDFYFSHSEIAGMLLDYKNCNQLDFDEKEIVSSIFEFTYGQPFLVSSIFKIMFCESLSWNVQGVETAVEILIEGTNKYFDCLISDLKYYSELNDFLRNIVVDDSVVDFDADDNCIKIASMLNYITCKNGKVAIANRILEEFLYDYFLGDSNPYGVERRVEVAYNNPVIKLAFIQLQEKNVNTGSSSPKKILSRNELIERLKAIAEDETPREEHFGAMCYSPIANQIMIRLKCDLCSTNIDVYDDEDYKNIFSIVSTIKTLGYDVKVETVCRNCAKIISEQNNLPKDTYWNRIYFVFYFRLSDDVDYHCVIDNDSSHYKSLQTFLENEKMFFGKRDESHYLADEIDVIEFMTGLKLNE